MAQIPSPQNKPFPSPRALRLAAPLLAGALVVGACSKSNDTSTSATTAASGASSSTTQGTSGGSNGTASKGTTPGTVASTTNINKKVWFRGFRYDLGEVRFDPEKQEVTIATKVTNLGEETATADPPASLVNNGSQLGRGSLNKSDAITGTKTIDDELVFTNFEQFSTAGTSLVISDGAGYQEVKVPLDGKGDAVTLEPIAQKEAVAPMTVGTVTVSPKAAELRFDIPNDHSIEANAGNVFLLIAAPTKNAGASTVQFVPTGVTLTNDGGIYPADFIAGDVIDAGQTNDKTMFYFEIKQPADGSWTLDMKDQPFGPEGAAASATQKVTLTTKTSSTPGTTR